MAELIKYEFVCAFGFMFNAICCYSIINNKVHKDDGNPQRLCKAAILSGNIKVRNGIKYISNNRKNDSLKKEIKH